MQEIFFQISIVLLIVLLVSFIMRFLKQPLIIGYIISGILIGPFILNISTDKEIISTFADFGIAFLLFIVGLHLSPKVIKEFGKISLFVGIMQVTITAILGYFIGRLLGFNLITSLYLAIALTFSSTIIIMKLLADKESLDKLYGRISIGILLVQDFVVIVVIIIISSFSKNLEFGEALISVILKLGLLFLVFFPLGYYVLPKLSNFLGKSQEFLFLFAIAWGLGIASLFSYFGFSIEAGALIAGIMLSMSPYSYEISSKLAPLKDFFVISFFISLGSQMIFGEITKLIFPAIAFTIFILLIKPLIVMIILGILGYSRNTGFLTGLTNAQISEFSLILLALGVKFGHLSKEIVSVITIIGVFTIAISSYLIIYSDTIYSKIHNYLRIFEKKKIKESILKNKEYEFLLFGENRIGFSIMKAFKKMRKNYLIVDYNPERVRKLGRSGADCIYGDISNQEFLDKLKLDKVKLAVSTIPERDANLLLIKRIRTKSKEAIVIVTGRQISEAFDLYKAGADYVIMPHFLGGEHTAELIERAKNNKEIYEQEKSKQLKDLQERLSQGQEHPKISRV